MDTHVIFAIMQFHPAVSRPIGNKLQPMQSVECIGVILNEGNPHKIHEGGETQFLICCAAFRGVHCTKYVSERAKYSQDCPTFPVWHPNLAILTRQKQNRVIRKQHVICLILDL